MSRYTWENALKSVLRQRSCAASHALLVVWQAVQLLFRPLISSQVQPDFSKGNGITDAFVTLDKPLELYVTGDHAYVVTRDDFTVKGKLMKQTGSIHTVVLHKSSSGWRITGEGWASTASAAPANN
jgi:hypothetical protein